MRKIFRGILLLLVAVVIAVGVYISNNLVTRENKVWEQSTQYASLLGEDKIYAATEKILTKWTGKAPKKLKNWRDFEPKASDQNQLLFIFKQQLRTPTAQNKILDWVAQGNHLVSGVERRSELVDKKVDTKSLGEFTGLAGRLKVKKINSERLPPHVLVKNNQLKVHPLCIKERVQNEQAWRTIGEVTSVAAKTYANQTLQQLIDIRTTKEALLEYADIVLIGFLIRCTLHLNELKLPEGETMFVLAAGNSWGGEALAYFGTTAPIFTGKSPTGSDIIKIAYGKGTVTFINDSSLFTNPNIPTAEGRNTIRQFDHAWFLTYLSQGKSQILLLPKAKDFIEKNSKPSLLTVLRQKTPELSVAILVLGLLFIWQKIWRHGTILAPLSLARCRLEEHFHAQGEFVHRNLGLTVLIAQLQDELWLHIARRIPNINTMPNAQKIEELKRLTKLSSIDLMYLLKPLPTKLSPFDLVKYVISLQKIRNKL